jgi:hypothetical protein
MITNFAYSYLSAARSVLTTLGAPFGAEQGLGM